MGLTFIGADHEMMGSCHHLEVGETKLLVDCGMERGGSTYENTDLSVSYAEIEYVLLTHTHIDHVGHLPFIYTRGSQEKVTTTVITEGLCNIMLKDSTHIREMEAEWKGREAGRAGRPEEPPLYTLNDAAGLLEHIEVHEYSETVKLSDSVTIYFVDVGHLLGSASIKVWCREENVEKKIVFSGDIGNKNKPLIRDPHYIKEADYVVMEYTYDDREHAKSRNHMTDLAHITQGTLDRGGNVMIPAFAVDRTQELLYFIRKVKHDGVVKGRDNFEVYVDSPLAVETTHVFTENLLCCYDDETRVLVEQGINPISFPGLELSVNSEESKAIDFDPGARVIISAAGVCDVGRIHHHLKHNPWRSECSVVLADYQAMGTLGRTLQEGTRAVNLFGESIDVEARIETIEGFSDHADRMGLLGWIRVYKGKPQMVFAVHDDDVVCDILVEQLQRGLGLSTAAPFSDSVYDLAADVWVTRTEGMPIMKETGSTRKASGVFTRLVTTGERLHQVILRDEGGANKDLAKFADQVHALCNKWDR